MPKVGKRARAQYRFEKVDGRELTPDEVRQLARIIAKILIDIDMKSGIRKGEPTTEGDGHG
jgi:hypothetical protein